jgi:hypothetical protein
MVRHCPPRRFGGRREIKWSWASPRPDRASNARKSSASGNENDWPEIKNENEFADPLPIGNRRYGAARRSRNQSSADFPVCRIADIPVGWTPEAADAHRFLQRSAGWKACDTADWKVCATLVAVREMVAARDNSGRYS